MTVLMSQTGHHMDEIKRPPMPNTNPHHLAVKPERQWLQDTPTTYDRTWTIEQAKLERSMDQGGVPHREKTAIKPGTTNITKPGVNPEHRCHPSSLAMLPGIEVPHTPCALPMR